MNTEQFKKDVEAAIGFMQMIKDACIKNDMPVLDVINVMYTMPRSNFDEMFADSFEAIDKALKLTLKMLEPSDDMVYEWNNHATIEKVATKALKEIDDAIIDLEQSMKIIQTGEVENCDPTKYELYLQALKFTKAMMEPSGLMVSEAYLIHEKESENNTKTHQWPMICALKAATQQALKEVQGE